MFSNFPRGGGARCPRLPCPADAHDDSKVVETKNRHLENANNISILNNKEQSLNACARQGEAVKKIIILHQYRKRKKVKVDKTSRLDNFAYKYHSTYLTKVIEDRDSVLKIVGT